MMIGELLLLGRRLLRVFAEVLLLGAIFEQVVFLGEGVQLVSPAFLSAAAVLIIELLSWYKGSCLDRSRASVCLVLIVAGCAFFLLGASVFAVAGVFLVVAFLRLLIVGALPSPWALTPYWLLYSAAVFAERDLGRHLALAAEEPMSIGIVGHCFIIIALAVLSFGSCREARCTVLAKLSLILVVILAIMTVSAMATELRPLLPLGDAPMAMIVLYALGTAIAATRVADRSSKSAHGVVTLGFVVVLTSSALLGLLAMRPDGCAPSEDPLTIKSSLLLDLFAAEDPLFLQHRGVDFHRLRQAVRETIRNAKFGRGGSTISMQLAKVCYLNDEKTISRKFAQIFIALLLEQRLSKGEIVQRYLQSVPFAPGIRGLSHASRYFYAKEPTELSDEQELSLIQTIFDPSEFNPNTKVIPRNVRLRTAVIRGLRKRYCERLLRDLSTMSDIKVVMVSCG